jgi:ABC-type arginine transport system ATPase subunit
MKYSGYTKKDLLEVINNLEHNYNFQRERADNQFEMLKNMQAQIVRLEYALGMVKTALNHTKTIACETIEEIDAVLKKFKNGVSDVR